MGLQRFAALPDGDALLELDVAALQPADDLLQLLQRFLEAQFLDVGVFALGSSLARRRGLAGTQFAASIRTPTCAATERDKPPRS